MPKNMTIGNWSIRPLDSNNGHTGYSIYPKGERSHWSVKARLYPASDGHSFIISMSNRPLDARGDLTSAINLALGRLEGR